VIGFFDGLDVIGASEGVREGEADGNLVGDTVGIDMVGALEGCSVVGPGVPIGVQPIPRQTSDFNVPQPARFS